MSDDFKVYVELNDYRDPLSDHARIFIRQSSFGRHSFLKADGRTWVTPQEGVRPEDDLGIMLPRAAIEPLAKAIDEALGHASHADTESRVLREWLTVEQRRVDEALKR